ncbi:MAG: hypothetical protein NT175_00765 [Bacteroidetes bacterium]|nr:hypothetical protein [Bacteroidota bacterium]
MKEEKPIVVAEFDVLGFSDRTINEKAESLSQAYDKLISLAEKYKNCTMLNCGIPIGNGSFAAGFGVFDIEHVYFSDTIILWCSYNSFCFPPFCDMCLTFFCEVIEEGFPLRGGIAVGDAYMDKIKGKYLGKAYVEAVKVEQAQDWIGVSFGPSFAKDPYKNLFMANDVLVYREHTKPGKSMYIPGLVLT